MFPPRRASPSSSWPRTPPFQGGDTGSNPVGDASFLSKIKGPSRRAPGVQCDLPDESAQCLRLHRDIVPARRLQVRAAYQRRHQLELRTSPDRSRRRRVSRVLFAWRWTGLASPASNAPASQPGSPGLGCLDSCAVESARPRGRAVGRVDPQVDAEAQARTCGSPRALPPRHS